MAIELIAIDIDGTLLDPQHQITPAVRAAIAAARDRGVHVVLATGRPFVGVRRFLDELGLRRHGHYCITNNGALVQDALDGTPIAETVLSFDDYLYCERLSRELGVHFHALDHQFLYTANRDISAYTVYESNLSGIPLKFRRVDEMDPSMVFPKVMMIDEPDVLDAAIARLPAEARERYTIMKSAPYFLEILDKRVDKGEGVRRLAGHLGLDASQVMALGDQQNDLAMIRYAGLGVAMGNALDEVKAAADHVTASNREDGVARAIERFVLDVAPQAA
jgi:hypothetical protein